MIEQLFHHLERKLVLSLQASNLLLISGAYYAIVLGWGARRVVGCVAGSVFCRSSEVHTA